jgi:hypothetical protein
MLIEDSESSGNRQGLRGRTAGAVCAPVRPHLVILGSPAARGTEDNHVFAAFVATG